MCDWSFQVLGEISIWEEWRVERTYGWGCPRRHPLFRLCSSVTLHGAIFLFTTWYVFCLERQFFFLLAVWIKYRDLKLLNERESSHSHNYLTTHWSSLISFWSSLSFTRVLHIYPMSKSLNDLNIINLKLYMFHMLIPWGVMTS